MKLRFLLNATVIVFLVSGLANAGLSDWFYGRSWEFMETVGGVAIGTPSRNHQGSVYLPVLCDVSGLTTITREPIGLNLALVVTGIDKKIEAKQIFISVNTGLASKNSTCTCSGVDLGDMPTGVYQVFYYGSDRNKHWLGSVTVTANEISAKSIVESRTTYPYFATDERVERIKNNYKNIKSGMTPEQVKARLGDPDETRPLYEPQIWNAKQIGYTHWFLIQRRTDKGSVNDKDEKLVRVSYDLNWKVTRVDHWGFDDRKR